MDVFEAIRRRRSIHSFTPEDVTGEEVMALLEAARWAPSAGNVQPWRFVVVRDPVTIEALVQAAVPGYSMRFVRRAPVVIVVCADLTVYRRKSPWYQEHGPTLLCIQDTAAAIENLLLAACGSGLGACWVGAFLRDGVRDALNLPEGMRPIAIVPVGRTQSKAKSPPKKPLEEIVQYEAF
jgi:nitroreductase